MKGEKVRLAELRPEDSSTLFSWINDREQLLFSSAYRPTHAKSHAAWFDDVQRRSDLVIFGIRMLDSDELIGTCQLLNINTIHRNAELQIRLGRIPVRGAGLGTEALKLLIKFAFDDMNLHRVYSHVFETNVGAQKMNDKSGLRKEGTLREAVFLDGCYVDVFSMGLLRSEYLAVNRPGS